MSAATWQNLSEGPRRSGFEPAGVLRDVAEADAIQEEALFKPTADFIGRAAKRIRQALVELAFQMAGGEGEPPACILESIEWLHAGSLVIDDIQDDSHTRRNLPTMHRQIGMPLALNAGNWMYFRALELLLDPDLPPSMQRALLARMVVAGRRCHEGQALDLAVRVDQLDPAAWRPAVREISRLKTGSLARLATVFGALAAGDGLLIRPLARFGLHVGVALQMRNDMDELAKFAAGSGLADRHDDLRHGRITWPWAWAARYGSEHEVSCFRRELTEAAGDDQRLRQLARRLNGLVSGPGNQAIRTLIDRHIRLLAEHVVDRTSLAAMRQMLSIIAIGKSEVVR